MMGFGGYRGMMDWGFSGSTGWGWFGVSHIAFSIVILIDLILLGMWFWKQIQKK